MKKLGVKKIALLFPLLAIVLLATVALLASCEQPYFSVRDRTEALYEVRVTPAANGRITAVPERAVEGTEVRFIVNPDPGYGLAALRFHAMGVSNIAGGNVTDVNQNQQWVYSFDLPRGGVWVTAEFSALPAGQHSVSLQAGERGQIIAATLNGSPHGPPGTRVRIFNQAEAGFSFAPGYPRLEGDGAAWVPGREGFEFTIGSGNVTVLAEFARPDNVEDVLVRARRAMAAEEFDVAFGYYEIAWQVDRTNPEAIFYSTLGRLLSIGTESRTRVWLRRLGIGSAPGSINELLDLSATGGSWFGEFPDDDGVLHRLPSLNFPAGFPHGGFINYDIVHVHGGTRYMWGILLFWNFIGNNPNGFNDFVDDGLRYVFGQRFEDAASRAAAFPSGTTVAIHPELVDRLSLDRLWGSDLVVAGRAELDVLFAFLRSLKAGFEWAASYNWEMDLTLLRIMVTNDFTFNLLFERVLVNVDERLENDRNFSILPRFLPLRNPRFMRVRNPAMMASARANFAEATRMLDAAMDEFHARLAPDARNRLAWLAGGEGFASVLRASADSGGDFFIPEIPQYGTLFQAMEYREEWIPREESRLGINLGNFFTPGFLAVDRIVRTELGGRMPMFFGFRDASVGAGTPIADIGEIESFDTFSLEFAPSFREVFVRLQGKDTADYRWVSDFFPDVFPQGADPVERLRAIGNVRWLYEHYLVR